MGDVRCRGTQSIRLYHVGRLALIMYQADIRWDCPLHYGLWDRATDRCASPARPMGGGLRCFYETRRGNVNDQFLIINDAPAGVTK